MKYKCQSKTILLCAFVACILFAAQCAPVPSRPTSLPLFSATPVSTAAIIRGLVDTINAKNKEAALAYFADDPETYQRDAYYKGRERVATWLREDIDGYRDHFDIVEMKADGDKVAGLFRISSTGSGGFYKASEYLYTFQAVVQGGMVKCLNVGQPRPDLC